MRRSPLSPRSLLLTLCLIPALGAGALSLEGDGQPRSETRRLAAFSSIALDGVGSLRVEKATGYSLQILCDGNLLSHYRSEVRGGTLYLGFEEGVTVHKLSKLELRVGLPSLEALSLSGAGEASVAKEAAAARLRLELSGAGSLRGDLDVEELVARISGAGEIDLRGRALKLDCSLLGAGNLAASQLRCNEARVEISGAGNAELRVRDRLSVELAGAGSLRYWGDPRVEPNIAGVGSLRRAGPF